MTTRSRSMRVRESRDRTPGNGLFLPDAARRAVWKVPLRIREELRRAVRDPSLLPIACELFVDDLHGRTARHSLLRARLEHAVARTRLDAWRAGKESDASIAEAYGELAALVTRPRD